MMKKIIIILSLITLSACNQSEAENTKLDTKIETPKISEENTKLKKEVIKEAKDAYDFSYPDLEGKIVKLSDYRGKWVIANFWATWCPPCRKEIPDFVKFKKMYGDKVEILGIDNEDAEIEKIQDFVFEYEINYPILRADVYNPSEFSKQNTMGLPTTVVFNPQGQKVSKRVGPMHFKDLLEITGLK